MFPIVRAYYILKNTNLFLKYLGGQASCRMKRLFHSLTEIKQFLEAEVPCPAHWLLNRR